MNNVIMKIKARQLAKDGEEDAMELTTEGRQYNNEGIIYLIYEETELSGVNGCVTSLKVDGDVVKLRRYGAKAHEMHFEKGKRFTGLYETPMGLVDMEILTTKVENQLESDGERGRLEINYDISLRGLLEAHNTLEIEVEPQNTARE